MKLIKLNSLNLIVLAGLFALPISALLLHLRLHPNIAWVTYLVLFDIVVISLLFLFKKTVFLAFMLNSLFFIAGVMAHIIFVSDAYTDILISIAGFSLGYVLFSLNNK